MQTYKKRYHVLWTSVLFAFLSPFVFSSASIADTQVAPLAVVQARSEPVRVEHVSIPPPILQKISVQASQNTISLTPYIRFAYNLNVETAQNAYEQRNKFLPFSQFSLKEDPNTYWFLIQFSPVQDQNVPAAYLNLGNTLNKSSHVFVLPAKNRKWQMLQDIYTSGQIQANDSGENLTVSSQTHAFSVASNGLYDLTSLRNGGALLIYSPGVPSLWFSPVLEAPANAVVSFERRLAPILVISLVLLMFFSFWRGLREEGDARFWASLLTLCAMVEYVFGVPQNANYVLATWDMIGIVSASLAIFLLPHIGRHYMVTEKNDPNLDGFLQFLALPAIFPMAIILIPLPEYLYVTRFVPLWGLYAFIPLMFTIPALLSKRKGALFYTYFCASIGTGALLAFIFHENTAWQISIQIGLFFAMVGMFLAPRQNEKNIHDIELHNKIDMIGDFALNNVLMRDALFRIEAKLRDPFDRVMREACFLDFNLTTEEYTNSLENLAQKELGQKIDKSVIFAAHDLKSRTERIQLHTQALVLACRDLSSMMGQMPDLARKVLDHKPVHDLFNLKTLVLQACDTIRQDAQDKQVGLGWYIAPHISLFYRGDKEELTTILGLLLRDAVSATTKGMVSIRVRRANSPNPGHIIFTISDSGKGKASTTRSSLSLIKAWELSTKYNGQMELSSSINGLSISFSMECIAMDAKGEKPLVFASLDDITLAVHEANTHLDHDDTPILTSAIGESGGNVLFSKEDYAVQNSHAKEHALDSTASSISSTAKNANISNNQSGHFVERAVKPTILIICPLSIQRQTLAWYLNSYEVWEALDTESALAFYGKRPASVVIIHSTLGANACNTVLADIRFLEDNLGTSPASFVGLYQAQSDVEFLQHAGCNYTFPVNIGREDLCHAVATIMNADPLLPPIADVYADRTMVKADSYSFNHQLKYEQGYGAEPPQMTRHLHVGSVVEGSLLSFEESFDPLVEVSENMIHERTTSHAHSSMDSTHTIDRNIDTAIIANSPATHLPRTVAKRIHAGSIGEDYTSSPPFVENHFIEKSSIFSKFLHVLRPKPHVSLQDNMSNFDSNWVSDPSPMERMDEDDIAIERSGDASIVEHEINSALEAAEQQISDTLEVTEHQISDIPPAFSSYDEDSPYDENVAPSDLFLEPENDFIKTPTSPPQLLERDDHEDQVNTIDYVLAQQIEEEKKRQDALETSIHINTDQELLPVSSTLTFLPSAQNTITEDEDLPMIGIIYSNQIPQEGYAKTAEADLHPESILIRTGIVAEKDISDGIVETSRSLENQNDQDHREEGLSHAMLISAQQIAKKKDKTKQNQSDKKIGKTEENPKTLSINFDPSPKKMEEPKAPKSVQLSFFPNHEDDK